MHTHKRHEGGRPGTAHSQTGSCDRDPVPERQRRVRGAYWPGTNPSGFSDTWWPVTIGLGTAVFGGFHLLYGNPTAGSTWAAADLMPGLTPSLLLPKLALVMLLVGLNSFFAMAEIALVTIRKTRVQQLVEEGNPNAILIERMLRQPTRMMATIQTGETFLGAFGIAFSVAAAYGPVAHDIQVLSGLGGVAASAVALIVITVPVALLLIVVGQIAPKSLAARHSEPLALFSARPVHTLQTLLTPVIAVLTFLANAVVRPFGSTASFSVPAVNEEELKMLVEASEEQGVLEAGETEMINSILSFGDTVARKVMTPRIDLNALDINSPTSDMIRLIRESGHSRIPVFEGNLDGIVGIVHAKDLLTESVGTGSDQIALRDIMRPAYFIPENKKVDDLLAEFRRSKQQMAIVRDEYGMTAGLVTIEDLLEEIVGDIQDEYDTEETPVHVVEGGVTIVDGKMSVADVNDRLGLELPQDEADTIGGFVFNLLGHQGEAGESALWSGRRFEIEETDGRRILKVRVSRATDSDAEAADSSLRDTGPESSNGPAREHTGIGQ